MSIFIRDFIVHFQHWKNGTIPNNSSSIHFYLLRGEGSEVRGGPATRSEFISWLECVELEWRSLQLLFRIVEDYDFRRGIIFLFVIYIDYEGVRPYCTIIEDWVADLVCSSEAIIFRPADPVCKTCGTRHPRVIALSVENTYILIL